jgi:hypothetical protein
VDVACGVRTEFGATDTDADPRVLAVEKMIGEHNARLYDELHAALGIHPHLTTSIWESLPALPGPTTQGSALADDDAMFGMTSLDGLLSADLQPSDTTFDGRDLPPAVGEEFYLGFVVSPPPDGAPASLDSLIDLLDREGEHLTQRFANRGYGIIEWATSRGGPPGFPSNSEQD